MRLRHKIAISEKQSVQLHTVGQYKSSRSTKQAGKSTCHLPLVCACTHSSLANCNNTGSNPFTHQMDFVPSDGTSTLWWITKFGTTSHRPMANILAPTLLCDCCTKVKNINNSCVSIDPTTRSHNQNADVIPANSISATQIVLSSGTRHRIHNSLAIACHVETLRTD